MQCLETSVVVTSRGCSWHGVGGGKGYCSISCGAQDTPHPTMRKTGPRSKQCRGVYPATESLFKGSSFGTFQFNFYFFPLQRWAGKGVYLGTKPRSLGKGVYFKGAKEGPAKGREAGSPIPPPGASPRSQSGHRVSTQPLDQLLGVRSQEPSLGQIP